MKNQLKIGDMVTRMLANSIPMEILITDIDHQFIYCGPWKFDKNTGAEIDEELGWDNQGTGSFIKLNENVEKI